MVTTPGFTVEFCSENTVLPPGKSSFGSSVVVACAPAHNSSSAAATACVAWVARACGESGRRLARIGAQGRGAEVVRLRVLLRLRQTEHPACRGVVAARIRLPTHVHPQRRRSSALPRRRSATEHVGAAAATSAFVGMAAARPHLIPRRRHRAGGACAAACCLRAAATASEPRGRGGKVPRRRQRTPAQHCAAGGAARRRFHAPAAAGTGLARAARARARAWAARQNAARTRPACCRPAPLGGVGQGSLPSGAPTRNPRDKRRRITMQHDTHASATPGCAAAARCGCAQQHAPPPQLLWRVTRSATRWPPPPP